MDRFEREQSQGDHGQTLDRFPKWNALEAHDQSDGILPFAVRAVTAQPAFLLRLDTEAVPVAAAAGDRTRASPLASARTGDLLQAGIAPAIWSRSTFFACRIKSWFNIKASFTRLQWLHQNLGLRTGCNCCNRVTIICRGQGIEHGFSLFCAHHLLFVEKLSQAS